MNAILAHSPCDECNGLLVIPDPFCPEGTGTFPCGLCSGDYPPQVSVVLEFPVFSDEGQEMPDGYGAYGDLNWCEWAGGAQ